MGAVWERKAPLRQELPRGLKEEHSNSGLLFNFGASIYTHTSHSPVDFD